MAVRFDKLIDKLEEIRDFVERLREAGRRVEDAQRILEEIDELIDTLSADEPDELIAFRLLRMFIEKVKDFCPELPLLEQFLELYIAALRTTEAFLDQLLLKDGFIARLCDSYCRYHHAWLEQHADDDLTDEEKDQAAHDHAMRQMGEFRKYEEQLRRCCRLRRLREEARREREDAETDRLLFGGPVSGGGETAGPPGPPPPDIDWLEAIFALLMEWAEENLSDEERKRLFERLKEMFPPVH